MKIGKQFVAVAAAAILGLTSMVSAQMPEPFKFVPSDATLVARINFMALDSSPRFGPIMQQMRAQNPNFPASAFFDDPSVSFLSTDFPGSIKIVEAGIMNFDPQSATGNEGDEYLVFYGQFDAAKLLEKLKANGWTEAGKLSELTVFGSKDGSAFMTMPNNYTILGSSKKEQIQKMIESGAGVKPNAATAGQSRVNSMVAGADKSYIQFGAVLPASARQQLAQQSQAMAQQAAMMPGGPQLVANLPLLNAVGVSLSEDSAAKANLLLNYDSEQAAQQSGGGMNMLLPLAINMGAAQLSQDPTTAEMAQELQKLSTVQFATSGTTTHAAFPIPDKAIGALAQQIAENMEQLSGGQLAIPGATAPAPSTQPMPMIPGVQQPQ